MTEICQCPKCGTPHIALNLQLKPEQVCKALQAWDFGHAECIHTDCPALITKAIRDIKTNEPDTVLKAEILEMFFVEKKKLLRLLSEDSDAKESVKMYFYAITQKVREMI
jgi:hypothetical protein